MVPKAFLGQGRLPVRGVHTTLAVAGIQGLSRQQLHVNRKWRSRPGSRIIFKTPPTKSSGPKVARRRTRCKVLGGAIGFSPRERYGGVPEQLMVASSSGRLMPESTDHIEHQGKHGAEQNRGCEWEIEGRVFAAVENITRKAAYRKAGASEEQEKGSQHEQKHPKEDENFAELGHLILKSSMIRS